MLPCSSLYSIFSHKSEVFIILLFFKFLFIIAYRKAKGNALKRILKDSSCRIKRFLLCPSPSGFFTVF